MNYIIKIIIFKVVHGCQYIHVSIGIALLKSLYLMEFFIVISIFHVHIWIAVLKSLYLMECFMVISISKFVCQLADKLE